MFADDDGRMNRSVADAGGALLVISQFTLLGDVRKGRRPAFDAAERPAEAETAYEEVVRRSAPDGRSCGDRPLPRAHGHRRRE